MQEGGLKIKVALTRAFANFHVPLPPGKGDNGLTKRRFRVESAGHNHIEPNPVFRGMARQKSCLRLQP